MKNMMKYTNNTKSHYQIKQIYVNALEVQKHRKIYKNTENIYCI